MFGFKKVYSFLMVFCFSLFATIANFTDVKEDFATRTLPSEVSSTKSASAFAHTLMQTQERGRNYLYAWGWNGNGQIGDGTLENSFRPKSINVDGGDDGIQGTIKFIDASETNSGAIINDGTRDHLYLWGSNDYLQLGDDLPQGNITTPTDINIDSGSSGINGTVTHFSLGAHNTALVVENAGEETLYMMGSNSNGQMAREEIGSNFPFANINVDGGELGLQGTVTHLELGIDTSFIVIDHNGTETLYAWGRNENGQLGNGTNTDSWQIQNINVDGGDPGIQGKVVDFKTRDHSLMTIEHEDRMVMYSWGLNSQGQLGSHGFLTTDVTYTPAPITFTDGTVDLPGILKLSAVGSDHSGAIIEEGGVDHLYLWGNNSDNQLGDPLISSRVAEPIEIDPDGGTDGIQGTSISLTLGFKFSTLVINKDNFDYLYGWGKNDVGELGNGGTSNIDVPTEITRIESAIPPTIDLLSVSNIEARSVVLKWDITADYWWTIESIKVFDSSDSLIKDLGTDLSGSKKISGLTPNTTYDDWRIEVAYKSDYSSSVVEQDIESFQTKKLVAPVINDASISNITKTSVDFSWDISDVDNTISSIILSGTGVASLDLGTSLSGTTTIGGLEIDTEYSDWKLTVKYDDGASKNIEENIATFRTEAFKIPIINDASINNISQTSVDFSWNISDEDALVSSIILSGEGVNLDLETTLNGSRTIAALTPNTTYDNWKLTVEYNDGTLKTIEQDIASFSTSAYVLPTINTTSISSITKTSVDFNWNISDPDGLITSITLNGTGITSIDLGSNLADTFTINNLSPNTEYSDWMFVVSYNDGAPKTLEQAISSFTTQALNIPVINEVSISNITKTYVDFNWNISDPDGLITSITLTGTSVDINLGTTLIGKQTVDALIPNTTYDDWKLTVAYNDGAAKILEQNVPSFTTKALQIPIINDASVNDVGQVYISFSWDISDPENLVSSIMLTGSGVDLNLGTTLSGTKSIDNLTPNTTYDDWKLTVEYNDGALKTIEQDILAFTTEALQVPIINDASISNVSQTSVDFSWDISDRNNLISSIMLTGVGVNLDLGTNLNGTETILLLTPSTTYDDWKLTIEYNDGTLKTIEQDIASFSTSAYVVPTINNASIVDITKTSVDFSWSINDPDGIISSITLSGSGIADLSLGTTLTNTITIHGLEIDTEYNDWKLVVEYNDGALGMIEQSLDPFSTKAFIAPLIEDASISNITKTSVDFNWNISDPDNVVISIKLIGTGINLDLRTNLSGAITINNLEDSTEYNDWKLVVEYNNGTTQNFKYSITSFTTIEASNLNSLLIIGVSFICLLILFLVIFTTVFIFRRRARVG